MKKRSTLVRGGLAAAIASLALAAVTPGLAVGASPQPKALIAAHARTLLTCDAEKIADTYAPDATLFLPEGAVVKGRAALTGLYAGLTKPTSEGGLCGLKTTPVLWWHSGSTWFVKLRDTAPFLAKPAFQTDGYVFMGSKIAAEVTTFNPAGLDLKQSR
jgi:hypothetical protein